MIFFPLTQNPILNKRDFDLRTSLQWQVTLSRSTGLLVAVGSSRGVDNVGKVLQLLNCCLLIWGSFSHSSPAIGLLTRAHPQCRSTNPSIGLRRYSIHKWVAYKTTETGWAWSWANEPSHCKEPAQVVCVSDGGAGKCLGKGCLECPMTTTPPSDKQKKMDGWFWPG